MVQGETEKSIAAYAQAVDLAPTLAPPRVNLGAQLLQSGRLPEAEVVRVSNSIAVATAGTRASRIYVTVANVLLLLLWLLLLLLLLSDVVSVFCSNNDG